MDIKTPIYFALGLAFLFCLPSAVALILLWATPIRDHNPLIFNFVYFAVMLGLVTLLILWTRWYGRKWQHFRARSWRQIEGRFDDGEIVTSRKGRSGQISGYQVWLGYEYLADGEQTGLYTLPSFGEFPSEEVAEQYRKRAANREVVVRVSPGNSKHSCVFDEDVRLLIGDEN